MAHLFDTDGKRQTPDWAPFATWEGNALAAAALACALGAQTLSSTWSWEFTLAMAGIGVVAGLGADCAATGTRCTLAYTALTGGVIVGAGGIWIAVAPAVQLGRKFDRAGEWISGAVAPFMPVARVAGSAVRQVGGAAVTAVKTVGGAARDVARPVVDAIVHG